jgi:hypothetical protein
MKAKIRAKNKGVLIDTGVIRKELERTFALPGTLRKVTEIEKIAEKTANDVIKELNKNSSMRENQGAGSPYFERTDINRGVFNRPFENASVTVTDVTTNSVQVSVFAPINTTQSRGNPVDIFDVLENGRPRKELSGDKKIVFPVTRKGAERLIKKRLGSVTSVKKIFRAQRARYKKKNGEIVLVFLDYVPEIKPRNILGVIARDIEKRLEKEDITLKTLGIKGKIGKGKIKVRVK